MKSLKPPQKTWRGTNRYNHQVQPSRTVTELQERSGWLDSVLSRSSLVLASLLPAYSLLSVISTTFLAVDLVKQGDYLTYDRFVTLPKGNHNESGAEIHLSFVGTF